MVGASLVAVVGQRPPVGPVLNRANGPSMDRTCRQVDTLGRGQQCTGPSAHFLSAKRLLPAVFRPQSSCGGRVPVWPAPMQTLMRRPTSRAPVHFADAALAGIAPMAPHCVAPKNGSVHADAGIAYSPRKAPAGCGPPASSGLEYRRGLKGCVVLRVRHALCPGALSWRKDGGIVRAPRPTEMKEDEY